jgi:hypothetical protein
MPAIMHNDAGSPKGLHYCCVLGNLAVKLGMAESWPSTDLGEGLRTAGNGLVCNPIFFNEQPRHPPIHQS